MLGFFTSIWIFDLSLVVVGNLCQIIVFKSFYVKKLTQEESI